MRSCRSRVEPLTVKTGLKIRFMRKEQLRNSSTLVVVVIDVSVGVGVGVVVDSLEVFIDSHQRRRFRRRSRVLVLSRLDSGPGLDPNLRLLLQWLPLDRVVFPRAGGEISSRKMFERRHPVDLCVAVASVSPAGSSEGEIITLYMTSTVPP